MWPSLIVLRYDMPSFDASQSAATYEQPIENRLGDYGVAFPVGYVVWIRDSDDEVFTVATITDPTTINAAKAGSGDFGKAIFRRGKTYTVTASEDTLLTAAGFTVT